MFLCGATISGVATFLDSGNLSDVGLTTGMMGKGKNLLVRLVCTHLFPVLACQAQVSLRGFFISDRTPGALRADPGRVEEKGSGKARKRPGANP